MFCNNSCSTNIFFSSNAFNLFTLPALQNAFDIHFSHITQVAILAVHSQNNQAYLGLANFTRGSKPKV
jgi:hypothetical protein